MLGSFIEYGYLGLFIASYLAATFVPISSEAVLLGMIALGGNSWTCIALAGLGNFSGGMTNYFLGKLGKPKWIEKYLKIKPEKITKIYYKLEGKGAATAFFSFLPVVGNIIPVVLGYMRANAYIVGISMFSGKILRYIIITYGLKWLIW